MGITEILCNYVVHGKYAELPGDVIHESKRALVNLLGVAIGGCRHPSVNIVLELANELGGIPQASVWGRNKKVDLLFAALANGISSHVLDFDCNHLELGTHPSAPIVPAVFALGEQIKASGKDLLLSFVLGVEIKCQIGRGLYPSHMYKWHSTSTLGHFGAAAAAGKLLNLNESEMAQAMGLAATQASGLKAMFGTMSKAFHPGKAAMNGLLAAKLVQKGFTSSEQVIESSKGYARAATDDLDFTRMTEGLGQRYNLLAISYKPYACGVLAHPVIDGTIRLRDRHGLTVDQIDSIHCRANPMLLNHMGIQDPKTGLEAKFSAYHCVAVALVDGTAEEAQFSDEKTNNVRIKTLRDKTRIDVSPEIKRDEAFLSLVLKNGQKLEEHVTHALGSSSNPLSDEHLSTKFRGMVSGTYSEGVIDNLLDLLWNFEKLPNLDQMVHHLNTLKECGIHGEG